MGERASCDRGGIRAGERHGERLAASDLMIVLQNDRGLEFMSSHRTWGGGRLRAEWGVDGSPSGSDYISPDGGVILIASRLVIADHLNYTESLNGSLWEDARWSRSARPRTPEDRDPRRRGSARSARSRRGLFLAPAQTAERSPYSGLSVSPCLKVIHLPRVFFHVEFTVASLDDGTTRICPTSGV